ncbi:larval cuticle protein 2-like [Oratosquilla oratoria]|uniref:larval cuticle protein 2-like n=1 Tax=Oratosquilla oratoria TaxID=337810 RepID=UPI003F75D629
MDEINEEFSDKKTAKRSLDALLVLGLAAFVACRPDDVIDIELDDIHHSAEGDFGDEVTGTYSWKSPEGFEFFVRYVADEHGYRVVESNAVPVSGAGVRANGEQVPLDSLEDDSVELDD